MKVVSRAFRDGVLEGATWASRIGLQRDIHWVAQSDLSLRIGDSRPRQRTSSAIEYSSVDASPHVESSTATLIDGRPSAERNTRIG